MTFRLIDDCTVTFDDGAQYEHAVYRQNGDSCTVSEPETITRTLTLSDGSTTEETYHTGRSLQVDRFTEIEVKTADDNQLVVTGTSWHAKELRLPEERQSVTFRVKPGPGCRSCG